MLAWFLLGILIGLAYTASLVREIGRLDPDAAVRMHIIYGKYLSRYALLALALLVAVQQSAKSGLYLFAGFWLIRWVGVYLGRSGRIDWSWFE